MVIEEEGVSHFSIYVVGKGGSGKRFALFLDDVWGEGAKLTEELCPLSYCEFMDHKMMLGVGAFT